MSKEQIRMLFREAKAKQSMLFGEEGRAGRAGRAGRPSGTKLKGYLRYALSLRKRKGGAGHARPIL